QDARTCFEKCVELAGPRSATGVRARLKLAQLCQRLNDPAHVRAYAEDALKIDREHGVLSREDRQVLAHLLNNNPHESRACGGASGAPEPRGAAGVRLAQSLRCFRPEG